MSAIHPQQILPPYQVDALEGGLTLCTLENRQAPVVTSALFYRAGTRDEPSGHGGLAHYLEHMMFKGTARYGPGEIDRVTQALGGSNNAFTSHDSTVYYFTFAPDRWNTALGIEVDRMGGLTLDPGEVESERQVILEEISMYEDEPWAALEMEVVSALHGEHPYGRQVLGTREELRQTGASELRAFQEGFYHPANAILVVAGDVAAKSVRQEVERAFAALEPRAMDVAKDSQTGVNAGGAPVSELIRLQRRQGQLARLLLALPGPRASDPDHALVKVALAVLANGRSSRLHRALVDEGQLCAWVSAEIGETLDPGSSMIALEVLPGVEAERVEVELFRFLEELRREPPTEDELERAKRTLLADWIFGHEKVHEQALLLGFSQAIYGGVAPWAPLEGVQRADAEGLARAVDSYLRPHSGGVLGWSLPQDEA